MAHKTIYRCEKTQNELEITWEKGLINFHIMQPDGTYLTELSFDKFDMDTMFEEIGIYISAIDNEEK
jgi:hypothetical protein